MAATVGGAFHGRILRGIAWGLVVDEPIAGCDHLLILGGDRRYSIAAELLRQGSCEHILLLESDRRRLVEYGILPAGHEIARRELNAEGVSETSITLIRGPTKGMWHGAELLQAWLVEHPAARVGILSDRFDAHYVRFVLDCTLTAGQSGRVQIRGLADRRYDESNWWRSRTGIKSLVNAFIGVTYVRVSGRPDSHYEDTWDPDAYGQQLLAGGR